MIVKTIRHLKILIHAKHYISSMANGINPLNGEYAPQGDTISQERIQKCCAYVADILGKLIENGGEPLACAFALFKGRKSVLLGAVATNPSARGRGYASRAVSLLANENSEKRVFLFCRNDGLADFYGKIGFQTDGRWAVAVKS